MKKVISAVTACFVSSFLFLTGCSDPDAELKSKVPDSVDAAAFVDGAKMVKNNAVSKAINCKITTFANNCWISFADSTPK